MAGMGLVWVGFSLRGYGGSEPTGTRFFGTIGVTAADGDELRPSDIPWKAAIVELLGVAMDDCKSAPEPYEEFVARIDAGLKRAARWLSSLDPGAVDRWRKDGQEADIFVGGWLNNEQFDLAFPAEFLLACGRLGLPIAICTND